MKKIDQLQQLGGLMLILQPHSDIFIILRPCNCFYGVSEKNLIKAKTRKQYDLIFLTAFQARDRKAIKKRMKEQNAAVQKNVVSIND